VQDPGTQTASAAGRRQERAPVGVADFWHRSSGEVQDHTDRVFSVFGDDVEVSMPAPASDGGSRGGAGKGEAASGHVMPLIWEQRQAETAAAEADCMAQNSAASRAFREDAAAASAGPAAFRSNALEGLD